MRKTSPVLCAALALAAIVPQALRAAEPTVIELWPEGVPGLHAGATPEDTSRAGWFANINHPSITVYHPDGPNSTAVIVCPGGSYAEIAYEGEGIKSALWLNRLGVTAFILKYRLKEYGQPAPLQDVLRAIRTVRSRATEFGVVPDRVGVLGFSAGGHLVASAGTLFDAPEGRTGAAMDAVSGRPDFVMAIYPVITMEEPFVHARSRTNLLGNHPSSELVRRWSLEQQVTKETPPTFLAVTEDDATVPVENSLNFYEALHSAGVPSELHVYQKGGHGFSLKPALGPTSEWTERAEEWMRFNGWLPPAK
jgi:acetyl esterase/lipase